jgi:exopolysaccharide biosynthesis protein
VLYAEEEDIIDSLGVEQAVNLDGGGSTTMTLGSRLVTRPSDPTGERPTGDAVVLLR